MFFAPSPTLSDEGAGKGEQDNIHGGRMSFRGIVEPRGTVPNSKDSHTPSRPDKSGRATPLKRGIKLKSDPDQEEIFDLPLSRKTERGKNDALESTSRVLR